MRHSVELAAALLQLVDAQGNRLIPHDHAKQITAEQVISLFERDHYPVRKADGGPDEHWNITWRLRAEHKHKTAMIDQPEMAKQRRIRSREQILCAVMANKLYGDAKEASRSKRKIQNRGFPQVKRRFTNAPRIAGVPMRGARRPPDPEQSGGRLPRTCP